MSDDTGPDVRFIPAGAGNRAARALSPVTWAVHPRGRGEQSPRASNLSMLRGSSPRARGTGTLVAVFWLFLRFIPAGAGNRVKGWADQPVPAVHPRGRGEQKTPTKSPRPLAGSSPRARGTATGSRIRMPRPRFIPAGAGNSEPSCSPRRPHSVHPRGRGEQYALFSLLEVPDGSSPRARGTGA